MAFILIDGFDSYESSSAFYAMSYNGYVTVAGPIDIVSDGGTGKYLRSIFSGTALTLTFNRPGGYSYTWGVGMRVKIGGIPSVPANGAFLILYSIYLYINQSGDLCLKWAKDSFAEHVLYSSFLDVWHYVELCWKNGQTDGTLDVHVDGVSVFSFLGDSRYGTSIESVSFVAPSADIYLDDIYVNDDAIFAGQCKAVALLPSADGDYLGLTPSSGTTHYTQVYGRGVNSSIYLSGNSTVYDLFQFEDLSADYETIKCVQFLTVTATAPPGSTVQIPSAKIKSGGSATSVACILAGGNGTYRGGRAFLVTNPLTASAWTRTVLNEAQFGPVVGTVTSAFYQVRLEVLVSAAFKTGSVSNTLNFVQSTHTSPTFGSTSNILAIQQTTDTRVYNPNYSAANTLTLDDEVYAWAPIHSALTNEIYLAHTAEISGSSHTIEIDQGNVYGYDPTTASPIGPGLQLTQNLSYIVERLRVQGNTLNLGQNLAYTRESASAIAGSATNTLNLSQSTYQYTWTQPTSSLNFVEHLSYSVAKPLANTLAFEQTYVVVMSRSVSLSNALTLTHAVSAYTARVGVSKTYALILGADTQSGIPTPPPVTIPGPMPGIEVRFQLVYPPVGTVTDYVTLRAPELDNKDRLAFNRVSRESRGGGTLFVYADPQWPKTHTLVLNFSSLNAGEAQDLEDFLQEFLGLEIGIITWEQIYWRGIITNPNEAITQDGADQYSASIEFEGEVDETWVPQILPPKPYTPPDVRGPRIRNLEPYVDQPATPGEYYVAITDDDLDIGVPIYQKANGHIAKAFGGGTNAEAQVVGIATTLTPAGEEAHFVTDKLVTKANWTSVAGTTLLEQGVFYWLSTVTAGKITTTAPTTAGLFAVRLGTASTTVVLDVEIQPSILL